jgi:pSer/pThr/pTyr-binding forkhead associated (FHA) protein
MNLQDLEDRLRALIEIRLTNLISGRRPEQLVTQRLSAAVRESAPTDRVSSTSVPNVYTVVVAPNSLEAWKDGELLETLVEIVKSTGEELHLKFETTPTITLAADPAMPAGDFKVLASRRLDPVEKTQDMPVDTATIPGAEAPSALPENAFLIIEGVKVFRLRESVISIGRRLDNNLVIDDPRVSRNHAQLRAIRGRYVLFDLNSSGGTFINGKRTTQSVLYAGDVISLAGASLIFGQDNPVRHPGLAETGPRLPMGADRATAIIRTMPPTSKKKE